MKGFILFLSFMTRFPVPNVEYDEQKLGKSMKFFPIVGIFIGLILIFIKFIFMLKISDIYIISIFIILFEVILTGGIHLDGLADTFDGIFSYRSKQKILEIMKDSRLGTNGGISLILYFLLKFSIMLCLFSSFNISELNISFLIMTYPVIARLCSVVSCISAPYARPSGMGKTFIENTKFRDFIISFFITLAYSLLLMFFNISSTAIFYKNFIIHIFVILIMILSSYLFSKLVQRKIGGITGDTLGALLEFSEIFYLFIYIIINSFN